MDISIRDNIRIFIWKTFPKSKNFLINLSYFHKLISMDLKLFYWPSKRYWIKFQKVQKCHHMNNFFCSIEIIKSHIEFFNGYLNISWAWVNEHMFVFYKLISERECVVGYLKKLKRLSATTIGFLLQMMNHRCAHKLCGYFIK